jgi:hypothetical protein
MVGGTPAFSTTKTGHHDIAEILLKVALTHQNSKNQIITFLFVFVLLILYPFYNHKGTIGT